jgi:hypothetical protein
MSRYGYRWNPEDEVLSWEDMNNGHGYLADNPTVRHADQRCAWSHGYGIANPSQVALWDLPVCSKCAPKRTPGTCHTCNLELPAAGECGECF